MTNHFAALGLPESLLLDESVLRDAFHTRSALLHPDANGADTAGFQRLNDAFHTLRQPAKRLLHLLELHGKKAAANNQPPRELSDLFFQIGTALQNADRILRQHDQTTNPLQKALLLDPLLQHTDQLADILGILEQQETKHLENLLPLQEAWPHLSDAQWPLLASTAEALSYLGKWQSEIQERQTRITETTSGAIL